MGSYLPHLLHYPLKNFLFLFFHLFYPVFNAVNFSSGSSFSCAFLLFGSFFQNQHISFFKYLNSIFEIFTLQDTLTGLYYSGKISKTCSLSLSSYFSYFASIFLNLGFRLQRSLKQMSGSRLVTFIFKLFYLFVTSFKISCFSYDTSYFSIKDFHT